MAAALAKIAEHIGSAKKFRRAAPLLRQLLQDGKVQRRHADLLFTVRRPDSSPVGQGSGGPSASVCRPPCTGGVLRRGRLPSVAGITMGCGAQRVGARCRLSSGGLLRAAWRCAREAAWC